MLAVPKLPKSSGSKTTLVRKDLPWLADKDGVEVCWLYESDWQHWVDSGTAVYYFDPKEANRIINFFPLYLKHMKGSFRGKPVALENWQKEFIGRFFGWKCIELEKGREIRRYRTLFLFIPRKNGKSLIVAGLGLALLLIDGEGSPEVYVGASTEKQARGLFNVAKYMVRTNADLRLLCGDPLKDSIFVEHSDGAMQVITGVADTQEGTNPSAFLCDELHTHKDNSLCEAVETGMAGRDQPVVIKLTTAGVAKADSPAGSEYDKACKIRDGIIIDPTYLSVIYEAPKDSSLDDPKIYEILEACNPNWGVSVNKKYFENKIRTARYSPALINSFKRHHMNIWVDSDDKWIESSKWLSCKTGFDARKLLGRTCYGGLDLAQLEDINAFVLVFPPIKEDPKIYILPFFWCPEIGLGRRAELANVPYKYWRKQGKLVATPGEVTDYDFIYDRIIQLSTLFDIQEIAFDPYNATMLCKQLEKFGLNMVLMRQGGLSMNEPIKQLIALTKNGRIAHNDPVLDWMSDNACLSFDSKDNMCFDKKKSTEKIDGMVALAMGVGRAMLNRDDDFDPFEHGLLVA